MMWRSLAAPFGLLSLGLLIGCSGGAKPEVVPPLVPVSGKVTLDGQPGAGITVTFVPLNKGNPSYATTNTEGTYTLVYRTGKEGIPEGDYQVVFSKLTQPDGSPIPEGKTAADVSAIDQIPEVWRSMDNPMNARKVPADGGTFDFDITTK